MAAKRTAANELTHDNWDDDYEPEEAGTFKRASEDVIKNRVIKTARRRNPFLSNNDSPKNVFSGFDGFKKPNADSQSKVSSPFAFASLGTTKSESAPSNTFGLFKNISSSSNVSTASSATGTGSPFKIPDIPSASSINSNKDKAESPDDKTTTYYAKLKGLNESVLDWIKTHVEKNPFIILTPVFADYEKHLKEIENEKNAACDNDATSKQFSTNTAKSSAHSASIFGNMSNKSSESNFLSSASVDKTKDSLSDISTPEAASTTSFSFGSKNSSSSTGFSFGAGKPFAFANVSQPDTPNIKEAQQPQQQEDEDEPPKVEFTPVVEDGSIFQKRCKVFVKKDAQYSDRGVGQLFLKPVEGSEKIQLIVRADTSLGNLLLNFILNASVPLQRMGKNNVMLVSIPTPECKPPPVPILLRVKTSEEADDLLKVLQKHSK